MNNKIVLAIMDGVGYTSEKFGNAVYEAETPNLDKIRKNYPSILIKAHGTEVGLPSDNDMGNSEVGHNAMGCGQIYSQGAKLVDESIANKTIYNSSTFNKMVDNVIKNNSTFHFIGLLSDGNVHSNINHLFSLLKMIKEKKVKRARIHILLDGRDVAPQSALEYVEQLEKLLNNLNNADFDYKIASGGGRMKITMDRYQADWDMVKKGYEAHVLGKGRQFISAKDAIETYRKENPEIIDQDLDAFVIAKNNKPIGTINDNDSVLLFNFRGDRALEISMALDNSNFDKFKRERFPKIMYAGMLQYDGDLKIPTNYLVEPPKIKNTLSEELIKYKKYQYAISETQKYGHVTYFWNGNRLEKFSEQYETFECIDSDKCPFNEKPQMKAEEITNKTIEIIKSNKYDFIRLNFPNGDMVGHTGDFKATVKAIETVDKMIGKLLDVCLKEGYILLVIADHGNSEVMFKIDDKGNKIVKTSHTTNPVYFSICSNKYKFKQGKFGLSNLAATILQIFDIEKPDMWNESMIEDS